jgi:pimeloyl-ACP methyl ester carboxylesterase
LIAHQPATINGNNPTVPLRPSRYMTMQLFALAAAIAVPAVLTYGLEDVAAPVGQSRWLAAHIPTVKARESKTAGTCQKNLRRRSHGR